MKQIPLLQFCDMQNIKIKLLANPTLKGKSKSDGLKYTKKVSFLKWAMLKLIKLQPKQKVCLAALVKITHQQGVMLALLAQ